MDSPRRSLLKAISYRLVGTLITTGLAFTVTRNVEFAATIGFFDTSFKVFAFYLHERFWSRVNYGLDSDSSSSSRVIEAESTDII